jgi:hypothetical protein
MHPALEPLARRAWIGLLSVLCAAPVIYSLCYWRLLRGIVEDPDIAPGAPRWSSLIENRLPRFGSLPQNAIVQFSVRSLARSRQHRLILGFYLGIGLAFTTLLLKSAGPNAATSGREESMLLWGASFIVIALAAIGTRVAFAMPLDLRANWIFRAIGARGGLKNLTAVRRALLLVSVTPVWLVTAGVCLGIWPSRQNAGHLAVLAFVGLIVADLCLLGFRKIPFTCSWLPGKSYFHMAFLGALGLLIVGREGATRERLALQETGATAVMLVFLLVIWVCVRWTSAWRVKREKPELRYEEEEPPVVMTLGL